MGVTIGIERGPFFLGVADYGLDRVDVEQAYGDGPAVGVLADGARAYAGRYQIVVFAYSPVDALVQPGPRRDGDGGVDSVS